MNGIVCNKQERQSLDRRYTVLFRVWNQTSFLVKFYIIKKANTFIKKRKGLNFLESHTMFSHTLACLHHCHVMSSPRNEHGIPDQKKIGCLSYNHFMELQKNKKAYNIFRYGFDIIVERTTCLGMVEKKNKKHFT
jgi:hypothetical protein